jgi:hypothetical protein
MTPVSPSQHSVVSRDSRAGGDRGASSRTEPVVVPASVPASGRKVVVARGFLAALAASGLWFATACSGGGGSSSAPPGPVASNARLTRVVYGKLMDVFGLSAGSGAIELFQRDVLVGLDVQDERPTGSTVRDDEITHDLIGTNPDNLQQRLLITREIGSADFATEFANLARGLREVAAGRFDQDPSSRPFSVIPRNAAIQLEFSGPIGVTDDFFVVRDGNGNITGIRNTEAIQLLEIRGDPYDPNPAGDFRVIPTRIVVRDRSLILDPVLLGTEGAQYQVRNNASGLPTSPDQVGANLRIAIALEGPLRIRGIEFDASSPYLGTNNQAAQSVIRDFRSGNFNDNSADIARGFVRDPESPRLLGEMLMFLATAEDLDSRRQVVRLFKGGIDHKIDLGDVIRVIDPVTGVTLGSGEILEEPDDPIPAPGNPTQPIVRCVVRTIPGLAALDPRQIAGYPGPGSQLEDFLRQNAARVVLIAEYRASRRDPISGVEYRDDLTNFVAFSPAPLPIGPTQPSPANQNLSPFVEAIIRFTKPVDIETVRPFDSFFIATRNVLDRDLIRDEFITPRGMDPDRFNYDKFITPHLVAARAIDEDGSQTSVRLQPERGLYLDEEMRGIDEPLAFDQKRFRYFLHVVGGDRGIRDLTGNPIDFQDTTNVEDFAVVPFSLDTRKDTQNTPFFADNLAVNIVRRLEDEDEDEQPSLYRQDETLRVDPNNGQPLPATPASFVNKDLFGAISYLSDGRLEARGTSRSKKIVDDRNQLAPPPQSSVFRYCPEVKGSESFASAPATATVRFGQGIQNPLNPFGSRLQTLWREIDLSLSRLDPLDFNLDVEQMWWAPFTNAAITYDEFDRTSLFLGHSEWRPEPCVGSFSSLAELPNSGLIQRFEDNYIHNKAIGSGARQDAPAPHEAYVDQTLVIDQVLAVTEPTGTYRYLPLPLFKKPYFVYRDETVVAQGSSSGEGADRANANQNMPPYIVSPFLAGYGRQTTPAVGGGLELTQGFWYNFRNFKLAAGSATAGENDAFTGGLVAAVASPLLADFWTYCDDPDLPAGRGFLATGFNGWQIALTVQSGPQPNFRAVSGGFAGTPTRRPICVSPGSNSWNSATGGFTPTGGATAAVDNSMYWIMVDFLKRQTVVTAGFVDLFNPHRMEPRTPGTGDPRVGPYLIDGAGNSALPQGWLPEYGWTLDPPVERLPVGTEVVPEFRGAGPLDAAPWVVANIRNFRPARTNATAFPPPDEINFPLDPLKAGDAHIRKYDARTVTSGGTREWWTYMYNSNITEYTRDIGDLASDSFVTRFRGPADVFSARNVRYFNWRFLMRNNVDANPPVSPAIESFAVTYRFGPAR